ncbi:MAG: hypothetical protein ACRDQV_16755 [Pseudonocardiaceae bacterium]
MDFPGAEGPVAYRKASTYPSPEVSKRLRKRIWLLAPYNLHLSGVFGAVEVLLASMLGLHLGNRHVARGPGDLLHAVWESPTFFLLALFVILFVVEMVRFAHDARGVRRFVVGILYSTLQLAGAAGVMIAARGCRLPSGFGARGLWSPSSACSSWWVASGGWWGCPATSGLPTVLACTEQRITQPSTTRTLSIFSVCTSRPMVP